MIEKKSKSTSMQAGLAPSEAADLPECFIIMPISDQPNYDPGHFQKVYEDVFRPACSAAGYRANRADEVKQSNLIHLDILKRVVHSPMAICDLSSRNPNVLFELGLRQAFDKPTVLVKDEETPDIFDIAPIRYTNYRRSLRYRDVLSDQQAIAEALRTTRDADGQPHNVNSLIRLLEISEPAKIGEKGAVEPDEYLQILMAELSQLRREVRRVVAGDSNRQIAPAAPVRVNGPAGRAARIDKIVQGLVGQIEAGVPLDDLKEDINSTIRLADEAADFYRVREAPEHYSRLASVLANIKLLRSLSSQA